MTRNEPPSPLCTMDNALCYKITNPSPLFLRDVIYECCLRLNLKTKVVDKLHYLGCKSKCFTLIQLILNLVLVKRLDFWVTSRQKICNSFYSCNLLDLQLFKGRNSLGGVLGAFWVQVRSGTF